MPRVSKGTRKKRNELESAVLALIEVEERLPLVTLRIEQAIRRAGLSALLKPALDDLAEVTRSTREAKEQVASVAAMFEER